MTSDPRDNAPAGKPLMRSLGEFFGHVWKGIKTDPAAKPVRPGGQVVRREVQEQTVENERGEKVTLRRTTVDEVVRRDTGP